MLYAVHVYKHTPNGKPDKYTEELWTKQKKDNLSDISGKALNLQ